MPEPTTASIADATDAMSRQAASCRHLGSDLWATVLDGLVAASTGEATDDRAVDLLAAMAEVSSRPVHDAVPLRMLGAVHREALAGAAPRLAALLPSCHGSWDGSRRGSADILCDAVLATAHDRSDAVRAGLRRNVQTNEVGRAAALSLGFAHVAATCELPLRTLEVGASAGLLSCWDRIAGASAPGDVTVVERAASDIAPIDLSDPRQRLTMRSFVWPDQLDRLARLDAAIAATDAARRDGFVVERADAGAWLTERLTKSFEGAVTVVFHSIVWQYLPDATRATMRVALARAASAARPTAPVAWLRLEPATPRHADLRLDLWTGRDQDAIHDVVLAEVGYHGTPIRWLAPPAR